MNDHEQELPETINVNGMVDKSGIRYIGKATRQENGKYQCYAIIENSLCIVEVNIKAAAP